MPAKRRYPQSNSLKPSATARSRSTRAQRYERLNRTSQTSRPGLARSAMSALDGSASGGSVFGESAAQVSSGKSSTGRSRQSRRIPPDRPVSIRRMLPPSRVSRTDLSQRRQTLRRRRGFNSLKGTWRLLAAGAAATGLVWVMMQPLWLIKGPEQVQIEGAKRVSEQTLQALLPLEYPKSLLRVKPETLEAALQEGAPIQSAQVSRRLFPPGLKIQVVERQPVAIAELSLSASLPPPTKAEEKSGEKPGEKPAEASTSQAEKTDPNRSSVAVQTPVPAVGSSPEKTQKRGTQVLMDEAGDWVPLDQYTRQGQVFELPKLKVIGMRADYRKDWARMYPILRRSPVEVLEIDWRDPSNLKLKTDVGEANVGSYGAQFAQQLEVLDRMRSLPSQQDVGRVELIDLRSPTIPRLKMKAEYDVLPATE
ncbi:MAG: FtsQ-type POTRA domain-containing protein [Pseudanabaena sp. CRU_2_10]|nr:FtsQ-type POTRA domain-containing protein [Pseudanabaena sp. CRU_2_10]